MSNLFENLLEKVDEQRLVGAETLSILAGSCTQDEALELTKKWPTLNKIPYRIWEYADSILIEKDAFFDKTKFLMRGRLFGEGGDLTLRRDGDTFRWWFVGPEGITPPKVGKIQDIESWDDKTNPKSKFYQNSETALLWGSRENDAQIIWEDRVAGANLNYGSFPELKDAERVEIVYNTYSRNGHVEFVWYKELLPVKEEKLP